jgi:drug/metabolite transporter (DMT)-like permease
MTFWALSFVWYKDAFLSYGPVTIIFWRLILSAILLFLIISIFKKSFSIQKADRKYIILIAFFEPFCYFLGEAYGMQYVSPTVGAIIISTIPLLTPIGLFILKMNEKLKLANILGMLLSFFGIILVLTSDSASFRSSITGVVLLFVAVVSAIFFSIFLKKVGNKYNSLTIVFWQNVTASVLFLPLFLSLELNHFLNTDHLPAAYMAVIKLGVFPSTISFALFIPVVAKLGAAKANAFANLIPLITAVFSFLFLGEHFNNFKIAGMIIVIAGLFISQIKFKPKPMEKPA